jgi:hypothetical protein
MEADMCIARRIVPTGFSFLCASAVVVLAALPALAATISGVSGTVAQRGTLTITGSNFGNGPNVAAFDDFEGGTVGNYIMTGGGSAVVGQWTSRAGQAYYSSADSISGSLCFEADMAGYDTRGSIWASFPPATSEVFCSEWVRVPTGNVPGEGTVDGPNWKQIWIEGESTIDDDLIFGCGLIPISWAFSGGNCGGMTLWTGWEMGVKFQHGDWIRMTQYVKGGYTDGYKTGTLMHLNGTKGSWEGTGRTWGHQSGDSNGLPRQYEVIGFNGYGRQTPNCYPMCDDAYAAWGPSCRARVEIGNSPTYSNCTRLAICGPTSWSGTSITAVCNLGGVWGGPWYLFVVDAGGNASSGWLLPQETYTLTVNSGSGDGDHYARQVVAVAADAAASGMIFDRWTGDTAGLGSVTSTSTTYTMPATDAAITATYRVAQSYQLTVHSGSGSGMYLESSVVAISAAPAPSGYIFGSWTGDVAYVANTHAASTTVTMPQANMQVTALYNPVPQTVKFREGGGSGYVNATFDDGWIKYNPADDSPHGTDGYNGIVCSPSQVSLIAVKDLFTQLPKTTGGSQIGISQAKLHLFGYQGSTSLVLSIYRITTNWLPGSAGTNENNVSGQHAVKGTDTHWASGGNFSTSDYDATVVSTGYWTGYNVDASYDVTQQITRMYDVSQNYGMLLMSNGTIAGRASETGGSTTPYLEISYYYLPLIYALTVNSGSGSGSYATGAVVLIVASSAPSGKTFDKWIGDTAGIANVNAAGTTITMPPANATITATYKDILYALTVNSGSGSGTYVAGVVVPIVADAPPSSGMVFKAWTGDTACVADATAASTTLTMPAANAALTATYRLRGDLNGDGFVGQTDLDIVLSMWGRSGSAITDKRADIDFNNFVGQGDLDVILGQWGKSAGP